jgi:hypothetical protein
MGLKVIGSGLGRTGTLSLKLALEQLGFGPCHHMIEVFMHPESVPLWVAAGAGKPDWDAVFDGYQAVVDYPGCAFWRELIDYFKRHDAAVRAAVPKDRLLVFEAVQGWEPLCGFLGVPVPDTPFPRENSRADFQTRIRERGADGAPDPAAIRSMLEKAKKQ